MSEIMVTECDNGSTILKRLTKMFHDSETADVCFVLKSDDDSIERILAHKNILAAASDITNFNIQINVLWPTERRWRCSG